MRVAHFDCFSGISGDMVLGAVVDAGVPWEAIQRTINSLDLPITLELERLKRCGFAACKINVVAEDQESYRFLPDVEALIVKAEMTEHQRDLARAIFRKVAVAEATVHGMHLERVHFHEVGALDSIADILGAAVGLDLLGVEKFTSSSVPTGSGTVKCAHGIMPIPTPGTAELLKNVPLAKSTIKAELTTPTGAAILTSVVTEFTDTPMMTIERIGTGAGTKDFIDQPNILRLFVGTKQTQEHQDTIAVLETNLDDVPGEVIGYTLERLMNAGALDAFATPIQMKKQRPGILVTVLCDNAQVSVCEEILFNETGTLGVRKSTTLRRKLRRSLRAVNTPWGAIHVKSAMLPDGTLSESPEYEDCAAIAREHRVPLREVYTVVNVLLRAEQAK